MRKYTASQLLSRLLQYQIVQGPLAGVSSVPFRDLIWQYSQPAWVYSEMISCKTILSGNEQIKNRYLQTSAQEGPLCMQIACSDPDECARACSVLNQLDISMIDLNVGCPVKKIRKRGQGSAMLENPDKLRDVLQSLRDHSAVPISVKIRVDGQSQSRHNEQVLEVVNAVKPDFLVVHGRHYQSGYDVPCDHEQIAFFATNSQVPVIGNGDVASATQVQKILSTGCSGAMISRASVGAPWLIGQIQSELGSVQNGVVTVDCEQSWKVFIEHILQLSILLGQESFSLYQARGLVKYYAKRNHYDRSIIAQVHAAKSIDDLTSLMPTLRIN